MEFYDFPFSWECHHPNWRTPSFFRGVGIPPTNIYIIYYIFYYIILYCIILYYIIFYYMHILYIYIYIHIYCFSILNHSKPNQKSHPPSLGLEPQRVVYGLHGRLHAWHHRLCPDPTRRAAGRWTEPCGSDYGDHRVPSFLETMDVYGVLFFFISTGNGIKHRLYSWLYHYKSYINGD